MALLAFAAGGCSPERSDQEKIKQAVENLQSGAVVRAIEEAIEESSAATAQSEALNPDQAALSTGPVLDRLPDTCMLAHTDGDEALRELMSCFRDLLAPGKRLGDLMAYLRLFEIPEPTFSFSDASDIEVNRFLSARKPNSPGWLDIRLGLTPPYIGERLRSKFSDEELSSLLVLVDRRARAFSIAEATIVSIAGKYRELLQTYAKEMDRYRVLLALLDSYGSGGLDTARDLGAALGRDLVIADDLAPFLHPYALLALVPAPGREFSFLHRTREDPARVVQAAVSDLGGGGDAGKRVAEYYARFRDRDNPELPKHSEPAADAVRVAFIDSGLDFLRFPELGLYLGGSRDYADDDSNPWLPAIREDFAHGSATTATLLSVISRESPSLLSARKVDLRFWKVQTLRQFLEDRPFGLVSWESRFGAQEALRSYSTNSGSATELPKIVSVSLSAQLRRVIEQSGGEQSIARSPWLWVMAAGNSASKVELDPIAPCFSDLPRDWRDDSRILCVGALTRGENGSNARIADYSNHGERVDVYAYESYTGMCPGGTSCSTPAITAAVTMLSAEFPVLSSAQLKEAIVGAAETRVLRVNREDSVVMRKVRVFDPQTMMEQARKQASLLHATDLGLSP